MCRKKSVIIALIAAFIFLLIILILLSVVNFDRAYPGEQPVLVEATRSDDLAATQEASASGEQGVLVEDAVGLRTARLFVEEALAREEMGDIAGMMVALQEAESFNSELDLLQDPDIWQLACRSGIMNEMAAQVLEACDRALTEAQADGIEGADLLDYFEARGIARALAGTLQDAIEDFQIVMDYYADNGDMDQVQLRRVWIEALNEGENPFDRATLEMLFGE